jgi:S-adenosylmethionine/arginine decarboxylase-like enzyme
MLDCYDCPREKLEDTNFILQALESLPVKIGLPGAASPPAIFNYEGEEAVEWGISGVVRTSLAHVSVHTFPDKNHVFVDVFARDNFNITRARELLVSLFNAEDYEEVVVDAEADDTGEVLCRPLIS